MDMLVLIMLALFLIIISFAVIIYVIVRKNSVDKRFNNNLNDDFDDDEDDDDNMINIVMPSSIRDNQVNSNINLDNESFKTEDVVDNKDEIVSKNENITNNDTIVPIVEVTQNNEDSKTEEVTDNKEEKEVSKNENTPNNDTIIMVTPNNEKIEEVVNVLINKKNYVFLANNNIVSKGDRIKLILDGKVYFGTITKANYERDINSFKIKPRKLNVIKNIPKKEEDKEQVVEVENKEFEIEIIPKKKNKN